MESSVIKLKQFIFLCVCARFYAYGGQYPWNHLSKRSTGNSEPKTGCPEGWLAGTSSCYQLSKGFVTNRDFAVKRCALRSGHLVAIESEAENQFLSHAFASGLNATGPVLTGGEKVNGSWTWKLNYKTNHDGHNEATTYSKHLLPVRLFKWFPGWNGKQSEPSLLKRDRCLFLNNVFRHPNGSDIINDSFFWEAKLCKSTRKTMPSGFKFICEMPRDNADVGCFSNDGRDYRGNATQTEQGAPCINWTDAPDINPATYPNMGLGDHTFCRNPDKDDRPWCWTSQDGEFGFCSIPRCTVDVNAMLQYEGQLETETKSSSCKKDEFACSDQSCIASYWHCDMEPDCPDGDDELQCDYKLHQFKKTERKTIRQHTVETYVGQTNESCARLCISSEKFVCRSFSFTRRTRECHLSDKNSLMVDPDPSRREDYYELKYYLDDCAGMFKCNNGRCIQNDSVCTGEDDCKDLTDEHQCASGSPVEVSLVGGGESSGTVQVTYLGQTGVICDDRFDDRDAAVICRMLGFEGHARAVAGSFYGSGHGRILIDELRCNGTESSLEQCRHSGWTEHDCFKWEVAGVECSLINDLQVELIDGVDAESGRVELVYDGLRGTICNDHWDDKDASVICRMLGFSYGMADTDTLFGAGDNSLHILLDDVKCKGDEDSIADCARSDWLVNDCTHDEDAGVICFDSDITDVVVTNTTSVEQTTSTTEAPSTQSVTSRSEQTTSSTTTVSTSRPKQMADIDCYGMASKYRGTIAQTETGYDCQQWRKNSPHKHKYHDDKTFPDGSTEAAQNYCRAPDNDTVPWCYTKDKNVRWGYCNVPSCGVFRTMQNQNITCGGRPVEAGRLRRDVTDEYEHLANNESSEDDEDDEDDEEIDTSIYRKMGRIMGGSVADYGMHPWQAGIRTVLSRSRGIDAHKCGATIIDEYWVLSAAHCFRGLRTDRILIRTGDHHNGIRDQFEQEFEAEDIIMHAGYNHRTYDYDIALIKLKPNNNHGIIFNEYVQPACLPKPNTDYEAGKKCHISGWGTTEEEMESEYLKSARVPIVDDLTCNRLYKWEITENMVCGGYISGGIDTCSGDSGGPFVCEIEGTYTLMGITSFGEGCAVPNAPGVYTKVTEFLDKQKDRRELMKLLTNLHTYKHTYLLPYLHLVVFLYFYK